MTSLSNTVKIRAATAGDIVALMDLERASPAAAHWTEQQYRELFQADAERLVLVAEEASRVSAEAEISSASTALAAFLVARNVAPDWELENIVVAPSARWNGLGTRLLRALFASAIETNSESVFLEVRESNTPARALYERAGFHQTGRRKSYYPNPLEDAVLYRLEGANLRRFSE
jgi:ribosomal-protein-alanine N-acetyltransferase